MDIPYENATSGTKARDQIHKLLHRFGCEEVGFMDRFEAGELILVFTHRGRGVRMTVSGKGWAAMYLKEHPWNSRRRKNKAEYEAEVLYKGMIAMNSALRDWVKGQVTAVECGIMSFETVFMPYMLTENGQPLHERIGELKGLLPPAAIRE